MALLVLVTYDVNTETPAGRRRLSRVAKTCGRYGQRVQNSVFECVLDEAQWRQLEHALVTLIDPEVDSLRFYRLGNRYQGKVTHVGAKPSLDLEGTLLL